MDKDDETKENEWMRRTDLLMSRLVIFNNLYDEENLSHRRDFLTWVNCD